MYQIDCILAEICLNAVSFTSSLPFSFIHVTVTDLLCLRPKRNEYGSNL